MSSKLNSDVRYAYMRGGAAWERLRVKTDTVLFAGNTVWSIPELVRCVREDALYKSTLPLLTFTLGGWIGRWMNGLGYIETYAVHTVLG